MFDLKRLDACKILYRLIQVGLGTLNLQMLFPVNDFLGLQEFLTVLGPNKSQAQAGSL